MRGWLHDPNPEAAAATGNVSRGLVLTHGAGANCESPLIRAVAEGFADGGYWVLRCDLPFRQARPHGPPFPAIAARDREGLRIAVEAVQELGAERVYLGGHSYGGRQATILAASLAEISGADGPAPNWIAGLLLLSYPLHPPRKPAELRTAHFPKLRTPAVFIHGTRDPFGSIGEMTEALRAIPARTQLVEIAGAGHGLSPAVADACVRALSDL